VQSAVSRQKQLSVVFDVANAQKQGAADAECTEAEDVTIFQELVHSYNPSTTPWSPSLCTREALWSTLAKVCLIHHLLRKRSPFPYTLRWGRLKRLTRRFLVSNLQLRIK
jgi:hypothetical protein